MKPRPLVIPSTNVSEIHSTSVAPARPAQAPPNSVPLQRMGSTRTPCACAASARSPTARTARPSCVRSRNKPTASTRITARAMNAFSPDASSPICGAPPCPSSGGKSRRYTVPVAPSAKRLRAAPHTMGSARRQSTKAAKTAASAVPATIPASAASSADSLPTPIANAANAPASIMPSIPMLSTPERSATSSPMAAMQSGVASRSVARISASRPTSIFSSSASAAQSPPRKRSRALRSSAR